MTEVETIVCYKNTRWQNLNKQNWLQVGSLLLLITKNEASDYVSEWLIANIFDLLEQKNR